MSYFDDADAMRQALAATPNWSRIKGDFLDDDTAGAIIDEAAKLAEGQIAPLNPVGDQVGARFADGKVTMPAGFSEAFQALAEGGWLGLETPEDLGGQGLPQTMFAVTDPAFERACPAIMMGVSAGAGASALLADWADEATRADWVPALAAGERAATICISEPEAGSDVGRIRTRAVQRDGQWLVSGQKIWISFGDHDLTGRIGHCLLARSNDAPGTRGLSLFLVERGPGVTCERIEEKLGLHGSPTCALQFADAPATLIGEEGRGLPQLFTMIKHMRLQVGCQGLGAALGSYAIAAEHAQTRRQGGNPKDKPVPIISHPDIKRRLLDMKTSIDLFRLALLEAATTGDLAGDDPALTALSGWMLPLIKTFGAELGFDTASAAIQVLGGAGYTQDYALEQYLRDARVFAIYEGTTGIQALDFLMRQSLSGPALDTFLTAARGACEDGTPERDVIEGFAEFAARVAAMDNKARVAAMADGFMRAGWVAVQAWMAPRLGDEAARAHFRATALPRLALHIAEAEGAVALA